MTSLPKVDARKRPEVLAAIERHANRQTLDHLRTIAGADVTNVRRRLQHAQATRLFVRTFGAVEIHRASWSGPVVRIDKKRVRALVGVLAANAGNRISRDVVVDLLWPDSDGDSGINSLNQAVFQLRRLLDPSYHAGESAEYVVSNAELVGFNAQLVQTDLEELRRFPSLIADSDWRRRQALAEKTLDLLRGEYLGDLRYDDWAGRLQVSVHGEVRRVLLPIAAAGSNEYRSEIAARAAEILLGLDPYDDAAVVALATAVASGGRKVAARGIVAEYVTRVQNEFQELPSEAVLMAAEELGVPPPSTHS